MINLSFCISLGIQHMKSPNLAVFPHSPSLHRCAQPADIVQNAGLGAEVALGTSMFTMTVSTLIVGILLILVGELLPANEDSVYTD